MAQAVDLTLASAVSDVAQALTALKNAIDNRDTHSIGPIITGSGCDPNQLLQPHEIFNGDTIVHYATRLGMSASPCLAQLCDFLPSGVVCLNSSGQTALHVAAKGKSAMFEGTPCLVENGMSVGMVLLREGSDMVAPDKSKGDTAIHVAAAHGNALFLEMLYHLDVKATHKQRREGGTPPIENNAAWSLVDIKNNARLNALEQAASRGYHEVVTWLLLHGASEPLSPFKQNCGQMSADIARDLLEAFKAEPSNIEAAEKILAAVRPEGRRRWTFRQAIAQVKIMWSVWYLLARLRVKQTEFGIASHLPTAVQNSRVFLLSLMLRACVSRPQAGVILLALQIVNCCVYLLTAELFTLVIMCLWTSQGISNPVVLCLYRLFFLISVGAYALFRFIPFYTVLKPSGPQSAVSEQAYVQGMLNGIDPCALQGSYCLQCRVVRPPGYSHSSQCGGCVKELVDYSTPAHVVITKGNLFLHLAWLISGLSICCLSLLFSSQGPFISLLLASFCIFCCAELHSIRGLLRDRLTHHERIESFRAACMTAQMGEVQEEHDARFAHSLFENVVRFMTLWLATWPEVARSSSRLYREVAARFFRSMSSDRFRNDHDDKDSKSLNPSCMNGHRPFHALLLQWGRDILLPWRVLHVVGPLSSSAGEGIPNRAVV